MIVAVVGLGKIGVPLAAQFASKGARVIGYDVDGARVADIAAGRNPIAGEPGVDELIASAAGDGTLRATTDARAAVAEADVVVLIVPVDVDDGQRPDFALLDAAVDAIAPHLARAPGGPLLIVETTVPVGTTRGRVGGRIAAATGRSAGSDFALAFSPERVSSGSVLRDLRIYPKIVGGIDQASSGRALAFYRAVLDAEVIAVRDAETAEFSKLAETTYRDVNIALANEFARIGDGLGVDVLQAIEVANTQPYSHIHAPGAGVGGHCIPVYPHFLRAAGERGVAAPAAAAHDGPQRHGRPPPHTLAVTAGGATPLISAARAINDGMAAYAVGRLGDALGTLAGATVVVLGLSYRAGVKEWRHSSAFGLARALSEAGAHAYVHDPLFPADEVRACGLEPPPRFPLPADAIVVQAWHPQYRPEGECAIDFAAFAGLRAVLDPRAALEPAAVRAPGVRYVGVGR
ncbi:MAG: nucleotide sugar dehydrogenase [Dehalococcoidia bacterium]|nr:nucleotide sugar dehydrogenase [Dehalococcoidia bacterium]